MKKNTILFLPLLLLFAACHNEKVIMQGSLDEIENQILYLYEITPDGKQLIDSADIRDKTFKFVISTKNKKNPDYPFFYRLSQNSLNEINTIARAGETIDFEIHSKMMIKDYVVSGGEDAQRMWELDRKLKLFIDTIDGLYKMYEKNLYNDDFKEKLDADYLVLIEYHTEELIGFIEKNIQSFVVLPAFYQSYNRRIFIQEDAHLDLLKEIYFSLQGQYPAHEYVLYLADRIYRRTGERPDGKEDTSLLSL